MDPFLLFMFHVCPSYTALPVSCNIVFTCWDMANILALLCLMNPCGFATFHNVSRFRCGT